MRESRTPLEALFRLLVDSVYALVVREAWLFCPLLSIFVG